MAFFEDKSRKYRRAFAKKAFKKVTDQIISDKPKITQRIAKTGLGGKRKIGKAGLQFAATTEQILRSRDFWAGLAASSIAGVVTSLLVTSVSSVFQGRKKASGTASSVPITQIADKTIVPDEYSQYVG
jgi:hypothetical protein